MRPILVLSLLWMITSFTAVAQVNIQGRVTDSESSPIQAVAVSISDQKIGTITDNSGEWTLDAFGFEASDTIRIRFAKLGYSPLDRTIVIKSGTNNYVLNISLEQTVYDLEGLVVRSVRAGENEPFASTDLDGESLNARNIGQDMPFLLRYTPSSTVTSDAGTGFGYNGLRIRGSDATRTNVTINGVPLNDAESQGTFWVNLPDFASSVSSVQIQRGVGTSTNGAGAFGAGVHLSTLDLKGEAYGKLSQSIGSFQSRRSAIAFGTGLLNEQFTVDGRVSRIHSDGYIDRASADQEALFLSAGWWGKRSSLQAIVFHGQERTYQAWFGVPAQFVNEPSLRTFNPAGQRSDGGFHSDQVDDYQQTHYQLHFQHSLSADWALHAAGHYTRGAGYFEEYKDREQEAAFFSPEATFAFYGLPNPLVNGDTIFDTDLIRRRWLDNHFVGTVFSIERSTKSSTLTLGGAASRYFGRHFGEVDWARFASTSEKGYRYYDADADKTDINFYGKLDFPLAQHINAYIDLQVRHVDYALEALDNSKTNTYRYTFFNPKAGLSWKSGPASSAFISLAAAHREPGRFDFLDAGESRTPRAERLADLELGWKHTRGNVSFEANAFGMYYRDQLALTGAINQDALPIRVNIPESYRIGIELTGGWQPASRLDFSWAATISDNRITAFTEYIDNWDTGQQETVEHKGTQLAFSPPIIAHVLAGYTLLESEKSSVRTSLMTKYIGRQYLDNTSRITASLDPYWFSDMMVSLESSSGFLNKFSFSLLIRNVFDARFSSNAWTYRYISEFDTTPIDPYARLEEGKTYNLTGFFPQAGRNFMFRIELEF